MIGGKYIGKYLKKKNDLGLEAVGSRNLPGVVEGNHEDLESK
jgi:hypothetical protein